MKRTHLITTALVAAFGISPQAGASMYQRGETQTPVNNCQPALLTATGFRMRALAIANEGTTTEFLSCSFSTNSHSPGNMAVFLTLQNRRTTSVEVSCTLITNFASANAGGGTEKFYPKTFTLGPGQVIVNGWTDANDNGGAAFPFNSSVSCLIPPNVQLNATRTIFSIDLGL